VRTKRTNKLETLYFNKNLIYDVEVITSKINSIYFKNSYFYKLAEHRTKMIAGGKEKMLYI